MFTQTKSYDHYWKQACNPNFKPSTIQELLFARVSAFRLLGDADEKTRLDAKQFLLVTMTESEDKYDFSSKTAFVKNTSDWEFPEITAIRSEDDIRAIVYKIKCKRDGKDHELYQISFFTKTSDGQFKYTHKFNLTELSEKYCKAAPTDQPIRLLGDDVLHKPGAKVTQFTTEAVAEIHRQVKLMTQVLANTGGVGIAANQCAELEFPWTIVITGVNYDNPEHIIKAISRYPTTLFPSMQVCINAQMIKQSDQTIIFSEGCLSARGPLRADVKRASTVTVRHQDIDGKFHEKEYSGSDARVFLHELDHINNGYVYIQRIIDELSPSQLTSFLDIVNKVLKEQSSQLLGNPFSSPKVIFKRNTKEEIIFDNDELHQVVKILPIAVTQGLKEYLNKVLENRLSYQRKLVSS